MSSGADSSAFSYSDNTLARFTGLTDFPANSQPHSNNQPEDYSQQAADATLDDEDEILDPQDDLPDDGSPTFTLRSLVTTKEAGVVIGKGGKNVAQVRELTGVKAGVSKVIQGVHERILTVSGSLDSVAKAYSLISKHLLENAIATASHMPANPNSTTLKLLVSHQLMGSIIGKAGAKIKDIQETSGAKIVISKEMLPQSTERVIEVYGMVDSIQIAVHHIGDCILNDLDRAAGTILYNPQVRLGGGVASLTSRNPESRSRGEHRRSTSTGSPLGDSNGRPRYTKHPDAKLRTVETAGEVQTQTLSIPADMVGCIIGKGGAFINHIRRASQSKISISKETDAATNERTFTIVGTLEANEKALNLLYTQLESEKQRRVAQADQ